jgi:hypothetical protein
MDPTAFDTLTRAIARSGTRRWLVRLVTMLPLGGALAPRGADEATAQRPIDRVQQRTQQRNRKQRNNNQNTNQNTNQNRQSTKNNGGGSGRLGTPDPCQGCPGRCCTGSSGRAWCCSQNDSCCGDGVTQALCCIANQSCCTGALGAQCCDPNETCCNGQCCNPRQTCDSEFGCIDND